MSIPTGDNAFLHELELDVRAELTRAETGQPYEEAVGVPIDEWLSDPDDDQRYEINLRSLLGAVESLEDGSGPGRCAEKERLDDFNVPEREKQEVLAAFAGEEGEVSAGSPSGAVNWRRWS